MDKKLKEILKELEGLVKLSNMNITKDISKAFKEEASISITKHKDGSAETQLNGSGLALLITLAGLEHTILEKIDPPKEVWDLIKDAVGVREYE